MIELNDFGPIYAETNSPGFLAEPWNAFSSLLMLLPAVIFFILIYKKPKEHPFLLFLAIPLSFVAALGSTLFHAFRTDVIFLIIDVLPAALLSLTVGLYFWWKIVKRLLYVILLFIAFILIRFGTFFFFKGDVAINISYFEAGLFILIPLILFIIKSRFYYVKYPALATLFFGIALLFRLTDHEAINIIPWGTHWLWHIFSALGVYCFFFYLKHVEKKMLND